MSTTLSVLIPLLVAIIVIPSIFGGFIKISARILRYKKITWIQGAIAGLIIVLFSIFGRLIWSLLDYTPPIVLGVVIGFSTTCVIGGWFFSKKGINSSGNVLGWRGAVQLTALAYVMLGLMGLILFYIPKMLAPEIAS